MSELDKFISSVEYLMRGHPGRVDEFKADICGDIQIFLAYIEELEREDDRPNTKNELEAKDDASFDTVLNKYRGIIRDTDLGNLRRQASSLRRTGQVDALMKLLCPGSEEDVA